MNLAAFLTNLGDIATAVAKYGEIISSLVTALTALSTAAVSLISKGGDAVTVLSGYISTITTALTALVDKAKAGIQAADDEVVALLAEAQAATQAGLRLIHEAGLMTDDTFKTYYDETLAKSQAFDELVAKEG